MCFDEACQTSKDAAFLASVALPMAAAAVGAYLVARRPSLTAGGRDGSGPKPPSAEIDPASNRSSITSSGGSASSSASGRGAQPPLVFEDEATGVVFEAPSGSEPERDATGRLAFRAIGYTPWPVDKGFEGERVRVEVGPLAQRVPRTFVFNRLLGPVASDIVVVQLRRPFGVVFSYNEATKRAEVSELTAGGAAEQQRRLTALAAAAPFADVPSSSTSSSLDALLGNGSGGSGAPAQQQQPWDGPRYRPQQCVLPGDVLRAVTATNFVYPTSALFGAKPPERVVVLYGADKQPWAATRGALAGGIAGRQRSTAQWLEVLDSGQSEEAVDEEGNVVLVPRRGSDLAASNRQLDNAALATLVLERPRRRPLPRTLA